MVSQNRSSIATPPSLAEQRQLWKGPRKLVSSSTDSRSQALVLERENKNVLISTGEAYTCSGWRATEDCNPRGLRHSPWNVFNHDLPCDSYVPLTGSGYCELTSKRGGEVVHVFQKSCIAGEFRPEFFRHFFKCDMAVSFMNYKYQAYAFEPEHPLRFGHNATGVQDHYEHDEIDTGVVKAIESAGLVVEPITGGATTRGIVMEIYDSGLVSAYAIVRALRELHHCNLPIELWSTKSENLQANSLVKQMLALKNIRLRVIDDDDILHYMTKPFSIIYSSFDQVLFLDSDNFPLRDPTYLFDTPEFQENGAVFWKDFWATERSEFFVTKDSVLWELLGFPKDSPARLEMEMESGEILIDRRKGEKALKLLLFFTKTFGDFLEPLSLVLGDKDLFRLAWHMTQTPFHYIAHPPSIAGLKATRLSSDRICGRTMVQHDPSGEPLFFHRNGHKFATEEDLIHLWEGGLEFVGTDPNTEYYVEHRLSLYRQGSCYHCAPHVRRFFKEINYKGTEVERFEERLIEFVQNGFRILRNGEEDKTVASI